MQLSTAVRNAAADQFESTIGTSPKLKIFSGSLPANCAASDPAGTLVTMDLPSNWLADASGGSKAQAGTWSGTASGTGTAACARIYDSGATTCHWQGTVTTSGGGGDLIADNLSIASGQTVSVSGFSFAVGGA